MKPIRTDEDHAAALKSIEALWDAKPGTPEGDAFELLAILIETYEREHFKIPEPSSSTLHLHAQGSQHQAAWIVGTKEALQHLRATIDLALANERPEAQETFAVDGEGYNVVIIPVDKMDGSAVLPYTEWAHREKKTMPWERLSKDDKHRFWGR